MSQNHYAKPDDRLSTYVPQIRYTVVEKDGHGRIVQIRDRDTFDFPHLAERQAEQYNQDERERMAMEHRSRMRFYVVVKATTTFEEV